MKDYSRLYYTYYKHDNCKCMGDLKVQIYDNEIDAIKRKNELEKTYNYVFINSTLLHIDSNKIYCIYYKKDTKSYNSENKWMFSFHCDHEYFKERFSVVKEIFKNFGIYMYYIDKFNFEIV